MRLIVLVCHWNLQPSRTKEHGIFINTPHDCDKVVEEGQDQQEKSTVTLMGPPLKKNQALTPKGTLVITVSYLKNEPSELWILILPYKSTHITGLMSPLNFTAETLNL